jgi:ubiquinone biosynthesis accessory factor UbiJ
MKQQFEKVLEKRMNRVLLQHPEALKQLQELHERIAVIVIQPFNIRLICLFRTQGIEFLEKMYIEPQVCIEGSLLAFLAMNFSENQLADIFAGKIKITGDIDTAQKVQSFFNALHIDWEEILATYTNDHFAYYIGQSVKKTFSFAQRFKQTLENNTREYLQEELKLLPTRIELDSFLNQVDKLRHDVDRLDAKIRHFNSLEK